MCCVFGLLLFLAFFQQNNSDATDRQQKAAAAAHEHQQEAIRLNELAGHIQSEADAEALVDGVAKMFADELPPPWATLTARRRFAQAEFRAIKDRQLISDDRVASIWNEYARTIGASDEAIVTATEIHLVRDLEYSTSKLMWSQGWNRSIWTIPDIYTLGLDGKIAYSCRPLEAMRVFYDLDNRPEYLPAVRDALKKGATFSDQLLKPHKWESRVEASIQIRKPADSPVRAAEYRFIQEHGPGAMPELLMRLLDEFLPE